MTIERKEQEVKALLDRIEREPDSDFRLATALEQKVLQLCMLLQRESEKNNHQEMTRAMAFEEIFLKNVQSTLKSRVHLFATIGSATLTIGGGLVMAKGILSAAKATQELGQLIMSGAKASEAVGTLADRSNEAERVGYQHYQKIAGQYSDNYRQALNEANQSKRRTEQFISEAERARHQAMAAPAA